MIGRIISLLKDGCYNTYISLCWNYLFILCRIKYFSKYFTSLVIWSWRGVIASISISIEFSVCSVSVLGSRPTQYYHLLNLCYYRYCHYLYASQKRISWHPWCLSSLIQTNFPLHSIFTKLTINFYFHAGFSALYKTVLCWCENLVQLCSNPSHDCSFLTDSSTFVLSYLYALYFWNY